MATAFAVYSADDNSLNFYKRDTVPTAGSSFNGKTATAVYTGFETDSYIWDSDAGVATTPWYSNCKTITSVSFVDEGIAPISTAFWFHNMNNASLTTIGGLDKLDASNVTNMYSMFGYCQKLTSLDISHFDTSQVTDMSSMFFDCRALTSLDLSRFNTSKVTDMLNMFQNCSALSSLDVSGWDTANVSSMYMMFSYCPALTSLDLSGWNTANVTDMRMMFYNSKKLTSLDLSGWNTANVTDMRNMFQNCSALSTIYAGDGWSTASVTLGDYMFYGCSALPNFDSGVIDKTNAHYGSGGYLTYKRYISAADRVKVIFEKGAVDIIVNKIKNIKSGPTISASGDTLTITN